MEAKRFGPSGLCANPAKVYEQSVSAGTFQRKVAKKQRRKGVRWFRGNNCPIGLKTNTECSEFAELIRKKFVKFVSKKASPLKIVKFWKWPYLYEEKLCVFAPLRLCVKFLNNLFVYSPARLA